jgi:hypothetical protein
MPNPLSRLFSVVPVALILICQHCAAVAVIGAPADSPSASISRTAAQRCSLKVRDLQQFADNPDSSTGGKTTIFAENEINSYLALDLQTKLHPSLRSLVIKLEGTNRLRATAVIDFDRLNAKSSGNIALLVADLVSGVHELAVQGSLIANSGQAYFKLEEALLDGRVLPRFLVETIITAVALRQDPPFDPMQPSKMPYHIESVEANPGSLVVVQH